MSTSVANELDAALNRYIETGSFNPTSNNVGHPTTRANSANSVATSTLQAQHPNPLPTPSTAAGSTRLQALNSLSETRPSQQNVPSSSSQSVVDMAKKTLSSEFNRSIQETRQFASQIIHESGVGYDRNQVRGLRDDLGILLGEENLPSDQRLAILKRESGAEDAQREALRLQRASELHVAAQQKGSSNIQQKTTLALMASTVGLTLLAQRDLNAHGMNPLNWSSPTRANALTYTAALLIPASAMISGIETADKIVQAIASGTSKVIEGAVKALKYVKETAKAHPYASVCLGTILIGGAAKVMSVKSSLDSKFNTNFVPDSVKEYTGKAIQTSADTFLDVAEEAPDLSECKANVIMPNIPLTQGPSGIEGQIQGTILPSIAALAIRTSELIVAAVRITSNEYSKMSSDGHEIFNSHE